jgi:hypothetical protein
MQTSGLQQGLKLAERYQVAERLGEGGLCVVYRGQDLILRRPIAVKAVPPAHVEAYHAALRLSSSFAHSAVVCVYDAIEQDDALYLVQEYVAARSLDHYLVTGVPVERAVDIARQIALAVSYAHARGVVHGDLTPAAVLIDRHAVVRLNNFCAPADQPYFERLRASVARGLEEDQDENRREDTPLTAEAQDVAALGYLLWLMITEQPVSEDQDRSSAAHLPRADTPESLLALLRHVFGRSSSFRITGMNEFAIELERLAAEYAASRSKSSMDTPAAIKAFRAAASAEWSNEATVASGRSLLEQVARAGAGPRRGGTQVLPPGDADTRDMLADMPFGVAPRLRLPSRPVNNGAPLRTSPAPYWEPDAEHAVAEGDAESGGVPLAPVLLLGGVLFVLFFLVGFYSFTFGR